MANPPSQDWSRYVTPGADVVGYDVVAHTTAYNGPEFDVSSWSHIIITFQNLDTVVPLIVDVHWHNFNFTPNTLLADEFIVGPGQVAEFSIPVRGRLINITYNALGGVPTAGATYTMQGTSHRVSRYDTRNAVGSLIDDTTAYLAGGTKTITAFSWYEGPAQVAIFTNNNTAAWAEFRMLESADGLYHDFAIVQALSWPNSVPRLVYFPPVPVQVFVDNQGAAQSIAIHVVPAATDGGG